MLPMTPESAAFEEHLRRCDDALPGVELGVALLIGGVLHFVTDPVAPTDATWGLLSEALETGREASSSSGPAELVVPLREDARSGFLIARRANGAFGAAETALLRVLAASVGAAGVHGQAELALADLFADYLSPDVAASLLEDSEGPDLGGRTMDISVLFADLQGFTSLSERTPPAEVVELLNRYFAVVVPAITDNGGAVSAFIGDAVMGLFGAPVSHPEHPLLAVRAALALRDAVNAMIDEHPELPKLRVGVATGPATVGSIGSPRRRVFTAIGDTVNLASRLESSAEPGTVAISPETYAVVRPFTFTRPLEPLKLKGKAVPVAAHELLAMREDSADLLGGGTVATPAALLRAVTASRPNKPAK